MAQIVAYQGLLDRVIFDESNNCWPWEGGITNKGYGMVWVPDIGSNRLVHRIAYEVYFGSIPEGFCLDHLCRTRSCYNPRHLEAVTNRINLSRGNTNMSKTHCPKGHQYDNLNTVVYGGKRSCKACIKLYSAAKTAARIGL